MAIILSVETATKVCSVALCENDKLLAVQSLYIEKSHAEQLAILIESILSHCKVNFEELSAIAISKGPGSYTGLRIGTSTAKGLCFSLEIPLIAVNTLEAMAFGMQKYNVQGALLCPTIDARRMEVYYLIADQNLKVITKTAAKVIEESAFEDLLKNNKILFFGNGAAKCELQMGKNNNALFVHGVKPSASSVGALALRKYLESEFEYLAYFEPFYLKDFKANKPKSG